MGTRRVELQPAYVLHRHPYRDTSLLVEAFTRDHGRVGLVARGAKRPRSAMAGLLQPFHPLLVSFSGKGELQTLAGAEPHGRASVPRGRDLYAGFYLNELLLRLLRRHDASPELFEVYAAVLGHVAAGDDVEWALRLFERHLLDALGYGLSLLYTVEGVPVEAGEWYRYQLENGPVPGERGDGVAVTGRALLALASGEAPDTEAREQSKRLLRAALRVYLGDRPLQSRELYRQTLR